MFMLLRVEIHPGLLLVEWIVGIQPSYRCTLAAEEAWMSINPLHRIAARLRFGKYERSRLGGKR